MASARTPQSSFVALPAGAKVFILLALLTIIFGVYYSVFHLGLEDDLASARRAQGALEIEFKGAQQRQQEFLKLREEASGREALERQILRVLPESAEIPAFLDDLNRLAELSGLRMGSVIPQTEVKDEFYVKVPVSLRLEGRFQQLAKFFYNISRLERAINMENIGIGSPKVVGDEVLLSVEVLATTFRRPAQEVK